VQRRAALGVAGITAAWGWIGLFVRWVDLPSAAIVVSRCALAALALGGFLLGRRAVLRRRSRAAGAGAEPDAGSGSPPAAGAVASATGRRPRRRPPRFGAAVALGAALGLHWLVLVAAQQRAPLGTVLLITYLWPVLVTLLAPHLLGEHVARRTYVAAAVGLVGVAVLVRPGAGFGAGEALALLAAVSYAGITMGNKAVVGQVGATHLAFLQLSAAALVLVPFAAVVDWGSPRADWAWLLVVGVVLTAMLGPAYLWLLGRLPASTVGVLAYLEPVSAVFLGWAFLDEVPSVTMVVGGALVVLAGIMVVPRAASAPAAPAPTVNRAVLR
jgi:drug/metabolite transporter (DMT)-like permease